MCVCGIRTWLFPPHVTQDLNVAGNLFLGAVDAGFLEMVYQELVSPTTTTTRIGSPGGFPVVSEAWNVGGMRIGTTRQ